MLTNSVLQISILDQKQVILHISISFTQFKACKSLPIKNLKNYSSDGAHWPFPQTYTNHSLYAVGSLT